MSVRYLNYCVWPMGLILSISCSSPVDAIATLDGGGDADTDTDTDTDTDSPFVVMPTPTDENLNGIWGYADNDVWAVGSGGTIIHFDGSVWTQIDSGTGRDLNDIYGSSPDDIWTVGGAPAQEAIALHWDGTDWSDNTPSSLTGSLLSVSGGGSNDIYMLGDPAFGAPVHWNGTDWNVVDMTGVNGMEYTSVFELAADAVYVTDLNGVHYYDGIQWSTISDMGWISATPAFAAYGTASDKLFAACGGGSILHWNGAEWSNSLVLTGELASSTMFSGIHGTGEDDVVAVGNYNLEGDSSAMVYHFDGSEWTGYQSGSYRLADVWVAESQTAFIVGDDGKVLSIEL